MIGPGNIIGRQAIIRDGFAKPSRTKNWRVKQLKWSGTRASIRKRAEIASPRPFHGVIQRPSTKWISVAFRQKEVNQLSRICHGLPRISLRPSRGMMLEDGDLRGLQRKLLKKGRTATARRRTPWRG